MPTPITDVEHVTNFDRILQGWNIPDQKPFTLEVTGLDAVLEKLQEVAMLEAGLTVDIFGNGSYDRVTKVLAKNGYLYIVSKSYDESSVSAVKIRASKMLAKRMPSAPVNSYIVVLGEESPEPAMKNLAPGDRKKISRYDHGVLYEVDGTEVDMPDKRVKIHHMLTANAPVLIHAHGSIYGNHTIKDRIMDLIYALYKSPKERVQPVPLAETVK